MSLVCIDLISPFVIYLDFLCWYFWNLTIFYGTCEVFAYWLTSCIILYFMLGSCVRYILMSDLMFEFLLYNFGSIYWISFCVSLIYVTGGSLSMKSLSMVKYCWWSNIFVNKNTWCSVNSWFRHFAEEIINECSMFIRTFGGKCYLRIKTALTCGNAKIFTNLFCFHLFSKVSIKITINDCFIFQFFLVQLGLAEFIYKLCILFDKFPL